MEYGQQFNQYNTPAVSQGSFTAKTFVWMFVGLLISFAAAVGTLYTGFIYKAASGMMPLVLGVVELIVVIYLSRRIQSMSVGEARGMFLFYAVLNGITLSSILLLYELSSLIFVFGMTALYFGVMAAYGYFTKSDLSYIRPVLMIGLVLMLVYYIAAWLLGINAPSRFMCIVGVMLFVALTAYDTQKLRNLYSFYSADEEMLEKASIFGALQLYLDFINLFLYLIRLYGKRRN